MTQLSLIIGSKYDPIKSFNWVRNEANLAKYKYIWQEKGWPHFIWDDSQLIKELSRARQLQGRLHSKIQDLGLESQAKILVEDAQMTSAIEGEKLEVNSLRSSVARRLGLSTVGEHLEERKIEGLISMLIDATQNHEKPMTKERLWGWQAGLFPTGYSGIHKIEVGKWRKGQEPMQVVSGQMGKVKVHFEAPPSSLVKTEMDQYLKWLNSKPDTDGLIRAAMAHLWFVTIHPFDDGNGRLARALTDYCLAQDEKKSIRYYSLSSQISKDRGNYYRQLEESQKGGLDITPWIIWFLQTFQKALLKSEELIHQSMMIGHFWKEQAQAELSPRQRKVIQKLLDAGPDGYIGGMTNKKYVSLTRVSRETAKRDLADLEEKGILQRGHEKGRSVKYFLKMWENKKG